jgi:hypothetical protein
MTDLKLLGYRGDLEREIISAMIDIKKFQGPDLRKANIEHLEKIKASIEETLRLLNEIKKPLF